MADQNISDSNIQYCNPFIDLFPQKKTSQTNQNLFRQFEIQIQAGSGILRHRFVAWRFEEPLFDNLAIELGAE